MQQIADRAGVAKATVHYYFGTKQKLYEEVLSSVLDSWMIISEGFGQSEDPRKTLENYIRAKLNYSFEHPYGSKVWANEIIHGAPFLSDHLSTVFKCWEVKTSKRIKQWAQQGIIPPINPRYFLYMIWATTQHFADFDAQIESLNGGLPLNKKQKNEVVDTVLQVFLRGVGLES